MGAPLHAWRARGRGFGLFVAVLLGFSLPGAWVTHARLVAALGPPWDAPISAGFAFGIGAAGLHLAHLARARLRGRLFRVAVSIPGQAFVATGVMAGPWQLALWPLRSLLGWLGWLEPGAAHALAWLDALPLAVGAFSVATSRRRVPEWVRVRLGDDGPPELARLPVERRRRPSPPRDGPRPLRIVQIADPHLGPWQSVARLRETLLRLLRGEPDLVLLTGDFLTMESRGSPGALAEALSPLRAAAGRCFAVFGNHDHEDPAEVRAGLAANGVRLLVDEEAIADTRRGPLQILGADWVRRDRERHLGALLARYPRRPEMPRLLLLHDPSGFVHVPLGEVDLTLSGHTHGGQVGLLSVGIDWTVLRRSAWPDHGLFGRGSNRLYVHRGTGFYGFPLRVGVPGETSVLEVVFE